MRLITLYLQLTRAVALLLASHACSSAPAPVLDPRPPVPSGGGPVAATSSDLAVYAAAMESIFSGNRSLRDTLGLIDLTTSPDRVSERLPQLATQLRAARRDAFPGLRADTESDFDAKANTPAQLRDLLPTRVPHRLVVHGTDDARAWFPNSTAPVRPRAAVSRVGYSRDRSQAFMYIELHCPLCGWGELVLLESRDGTWRVLSTMNVWNS